MNDTDRDRTAAYHVAVTKLIAILLALLVPGAARAATCIQPADRPCAIASPNHLSLAPGINVVSRTVTVPTKALPLERPLTVTVVALASSEVLWNGRPVGGNGRIGTTRAAERPGKYFATIVIPTALVKPGDNRVTVRMSASHLWLPVQRPVHQLDIGPYETPQLPGRGHYLPAMLMLGAIAGAFVYFAVAALGQNRHRDPAPLWLAGVAGTAMLQLLVEVSRAYVAYSYPWHLARVSAIALLAAATAVLIASYSAHRFAPDMRRTVVRVTAATSIAFVILIPPFDFKAMGAILAGILALIFVALLGVRNGVPKAGWAALTGIGAILLMAREVTQFLDQAYYLLIAAALLALLAEQVSALRNARAEAARAEALEERLRQAQERGEPIVQLKDGNRVHRVASAEILYVRGADDYCEVRLSDGRDLLVTIGLARLHSSLPPGFIRVHKSYIVNGERVRRLEPRPGGGRRLALDGDMTVPVGRSYGASLSAFSG